MNMNTILYIASQRLPTEKAYGIQITKMCEAFADQGVRVKLLLPTRRNPIAEDLFSYYQIKKNFLVKKLWSPDFYLPGRLDRIAVLTKNTISAMVLVIYALLKGADIIYSRDELPLYFISFFKKNLIFEAHKFSLRRLGCYQRFKKTDMKVIAISNGIRDEFIRFGYKPERVIVAHDGVDLKQFSVSTTKAECRKTLALPQDKILVLYTGHLYEWKGAHVLAEAAKNLDKQYVVVFVGGTEKDVARYKKIYGGYDNLMFLGQRPHGEIPLYLKAADLVVLPNSGKEEISRIYTSPLKMFEYMASGTPIVASSLSSIREILNDTNSFLVEPDDPKSLADATQKIMSNQELSGNISEKALKDVENYTWEKRAENIINFINHDKR